jgi:superfamily II DNA or RNA helicase
MDPVDAWFEYAPGQRAIVFAKNVAHAEEITECFNARGVPAECITGETPRAVRRGLRDRLTQGTTRVLVSVDVFVEGWDAPCTECVILARSFGVCGSYLQAIGRGLRPSPATGKKRCTVLDLCGSWMTHGLPDETRSWSLTGEATRRVGEALQPLKRCRDCMAIFRPAARCPRCGASAESATKVPRVLTRAEKMERINALPQHERDRRYLESLTRIAQGRMRLPPGAAQRWALAKFKEQKGRAPEGRAA